MPRPARDNSNPLRNDLERFRGDVAEMLAARWELAELELAASKHQAMRLAVILGLALLLLTVGLTLAGVALADVLAAGTGMTPGVWRLILSGSLVVVGLLAAAGGYWRFRRDFTGLAESREELREDLLWLREWTAILSNSQAEGNHPPAETMDDWSGDCRSIESFLFGPLDVA